MIEIIRVGDATTLLDYEEGWRLQREIHADVVSGRRPDTLVLCEHPPVYTAGRRTEPAERPDDGSPVIDVDRGGKITWHGPGQLVGYPIVRLPDPIDVVAYVRMLETMLIESLAVLGLSSTRVRGRSGVWIDGHDGPEKVGAIGIRVAEGVTMHGFALNVDNTLEPYRHIVACGIADAGVTTVSRALGEAITVECVRPIIERRFLEIFDPSAVADTDRARRDASGVGTVSRTVGAAA